MFEKEAEERARKLEESQTLGIYDNDEDLARDIAWNEGKVAGYEEGFKDGAELGYNKANEWHYVKNGDLPRQYEHTCFSIDVLANNKKWVYYEFSSGKWFCGNKEVNVYAWKEITLPKEIEEK